MTVPKTMVRTLRNDRMKVNGFMLESMRLYQVLVSFYYL